jgi:hypothetical protein
MRRREFITVLGGAAAWPLAARAQQATKTQPRIAVVSPSTFIADISETGSNPTYVALFKELRRLGYIEGVNLPDWRWLLDRDGCPWYPTVRLFRQPRPDDWASVFARINQELKSPFKASGIS